jgi:UDP-GlcNAc:undecaprenyl-phosphate GlcNAc-1-phosphate transferase
MIMPYPAQTDIIAKLNYPHVGILVFSWFIGLLIFPWLIAVSHKYGFVDKPREYKRHIGPTPFLGGIGIFIAFSITIFSTLRLPEYGAGQTIFDYIYNSGFRQLTGIMLGGLFMTVFGLIDDFKPINAVFKLMALFAVTLVLYFFDIRLHVFPGDGTVFVLLNEFLTLIWIAGVISSVNSLDNMDGASGGVSAVAAFFVFVVAWGSSPATAQVWLSYAALALLGATLAFLRYNWHPAKIFLGDSGSFLLGFLLAAILVMGQWTTSPLRSILMPCMILTVPLFDITFSTMMRLKNKVVKGRNLLDTVRLCIVYCGRDHTAHRLQALGLSKRWTAVVLYCIGALGGVCALVIRQLDKDVHALVVAAVYSALLIVFARILQRADVYANPPEPCDSTVGNKI